MSLGASQQDMNTMLQIAQLDINQIMAQFQIDAEQARLFKETFLNLGSSLITPPSPLEQFLAKQV